MSDSKRIFLVSTTTGYQTRAYLQAAQKMGLELALGTDRCHVLPDPWNDGALPLRFEDPEGSAQEIVNYAQRNPLSAIIAAGDRATVTCARACRNLGLAGHAVDAAEACRDKYTARERLRAAGLRVPSFLRFPLHSEPRRILASATIPFPCVLKPLALSGSRGVIRADTPAEFAVAFERIRALLLRPEIQVLREDTSKFIQVESYVVGEEVAVEAVLDRGELRTLALFDKPDPLVGPFFEETIYVTPSRLPAEAQSAVVQTLKQAAEALGLYHGPIHAEFRVEWKRYAPDEAHDSSICILEVAARSIGGLCSRALRFACASDTGLLSLEELLIRLALGEDLSGVSREPRASGVMMIPIPEAGVYRDVRGLEQARLTAGVEDVIITAKPEQRIEPLPEGSSYLGFIFARGNSPQFVEAALRQAHSQLRFVIARTLEVAQRTG